MLTTIDGHDYNFSVDTFIGGLFIEVNDATGEFFAEINVDHNMEVIAVDYADGEESSYPYNEYTNPAELVRWAAATSY